MADQHPSTGIKDQSMKILLISTLYPPHVIGGAEKAAAQLAEALVRRGHKVVVASLYPGSCELVEDQNGVRVYRLPLDNFYWPFGRNEKAKPLWRLGWHLREIWNPLAGRRIGRILDIEKPDVVNTHNICGFSIAAWAAVKRRNLRLVHTLHDYYLMCPRCTLFDKGHQCENRCFACRVLTFYRRGFARMPDSIVSVSQAALGEHLRRNYLKNRPATVIHNIQTSINVPATRRASACQGSPHLVFGFIGRIEEEKGIETLLAATELLTQLNWKLRIAGRGLESYVHQLATRFRDSRIEWLGFTDAANFYSSVDVVVVPSLWAEPLPYVCVESLYASKSLICACSGGIPEIARLANRVEFFAAGDVNALAEKMNLALASLPLWRNPGILDPERLSIFQQQRIVDKYLQVYAPITSTAQNPGK